MADEPKPKQSTSETPRAGRPAKTRVGPAAASSGRVTPSPKAPPKKTEPRHVWERGVFWFGMIALLAVIAFGSTYVFDRDPAEVDLAGTDLTAFCKKLDIVRTMQPGNFTLDVSTAATTFDAQHAQLVELAAVSPPDLQADVQQIADATAGLAETARGIVARKTSDPAYNTQAITDLIGAFDEVGTSTAKAEDRVAYAARVGCNIDLSAPTPTLVDSPGPNGSGVPTTTAPAMPGRPTPSQPAPTGPAPTSSDTSSTVPMPTLATPTSTSIPGEPSTTAVG